MPRQVYESVSLHEHGARKSSIQKSSYERSIEKIADRPIKKNRRKVFNYKPVFLRTLSLGSLILLTLTLIGLLQYVVIRFPHHSLIQEARAAGSELKQDGIRRRSYHEDAALPDERYAIVTQRSVAPSASAPAPPADAPSASTTVYSSAMPSNNAFVQSQSSKALSTATNPEDFVRSSSAKPKTSTQSAVNSAFVRSSSKSAEKHKNSSAKKDNATGSNDKTKTLKDNHASTATNEKPKATPDSSDSAHHTSTGGTHGDAAYLSASRSASAALASFSANVHSTGANADDGQEDEQHHGLKGVGTFASSYLPTISAVLYRMLWNMISSSFNLVEPFRLLARPEGASASVALFSAYQGKAALASCIADKRWALAITTLTSSAADLLPALASQCIFVSTNWPDCPNRDPINRPLNPCPRRVEVLVPVVRTMQTLLALACLVLIWLLVFFYIGNTGLTGDPRSMAAVASLMSNDLLLHDLNQVPGSADTKEMQRLLSHTQYCLAHFEADSGEVRYGIEPGTYSDKHGVVTFAHKYGAVGDDDKRSARGKCHRRNDWLIDIMLIVFILGTFGVVLAYHLDYKADAFNNFFNSGSFGPAFVLTLAATVIATLWKRAEISMTIMAPYQRLSKKPSSPGSTILFKASTTPLISTARAVQHSYFVVATITIITLLADLALNVVISGVPYSRGQSLRQSLVSRWLSMGILILMLLAAIALLISRLRSSTVPRQPENLGVVMGYLSGGRLPYEFEGTEYLTDDERRERLGSNKKMYQLMEIPRGDGTHSWAVDEL